MSDTKGTGCGVWPILLKRTKYYPACEWHDGAYTSGALLQRERWTRAEVDKWFYRQMLQMAEGPIDRLQAKVFYGIVKAVGWMFWEGE